MEFSIKGFDMMLKKIFLPMLLGVVGSSEVLAIDFSEMESVINNESLGEFNQFRISDYAISEGGRFVIYTASETQDGAPTEFNKLFFLDRHSGNYHDIDLIEANFSSVKISANGRFVYDSRGSILDLKTGDISSVESVQDLSDNGRYAAIWAADDLLGLGLPSSCAEVYVKDLVTNTLTFASAAYGTQSDAVCKQAGIIGISGDGSKVFWDSDSEDDKELRYAPFPNPANRDVFSVNWFVEADETQRISLADNQSQENTTSGGAFYEWALTKDGMHIAFLSIHEYVENHIHGSHIYVRDVATLNVEAVSVNNDGFLREGNFCDQPSISNDARYVVFRCRGELIPNKGPGIYLRDRQTQTTHFISSASVAEISGDGQYVLVSHRLTNYTPQNPGDSGLYVVGNPAARDPQDRPQFDTSLLFVTLPNTESNWLAFDSLTLVDDYLWKGDVVFDGLNGDAFKFDLGGYWNNGALMFQGAWENNFGDNNSDGVLDQNGGNIIVDQGAGVYEIVFDESSMQYNVTKKGEFPQLFVRGTFNNWGVNRMAYIGFNTWEVIVSFNGNHDERFKFDVYGDWRKNYGDDGADGSLELNAGDINLPHANGKYRIKFFQDTLHYSVEPL